MDWLDRRGLLVIACVLFSFFFCSSLRNLCNLYFYSVDTHIHTPYTYTQWSQLNLYITTVIFTNVCLTITYIYYNCAAGADYMFSIFLALISFCVNVIQWIDRFQLFIELFRHARRVFANRPNENMMIGDTHWFSSASLFASAWVLMIVQFIKWLWVSKTVLKKLEGIHFKNGMLSFIIYKKTSLISMNIPNEIVSTRERENFRVLFGLF